MGQACLKPSVVRTEFIHPPIPTRNCDWQAVLDGYEPGDPIGHGSTEAAAVRDLMIEIEATGEGG
jgi:hypothetical protein